MGGEDRREEGGEGKDGEVDVRKEGRVKVSGGYEQGEFQTPTSLALVSLTQPIALTLTLSPT